MNPVMIFESVDEFVVDDREWFALSNVVDKVYNHVLVVRKSVQFDYGFERGACAESLREIGTPEYAEFGDASWNFDRARNAIRPGTHIWRNVGTRVRVTYVAKHSIEPIPFVAPPDVAEQARSIKLRRIS